jgi:hypothetical protein
MKFPPLAKTKLWLIINSLGIGLGLLPVAYFSFYPSSEAHLRFLPPLLLLTSKICAAILSAWISVVLINTALRRHERSRAAAQSILSALDAVELSAVYFVHVWERGRFYELVFRLEMLRDSIGRAPGNIQRRLHGEISDLDTLHYDLQLVSHAVFDLTRLKAEAALQFPKALNHDRGDILVDLQKKFDQFCDPQTMSSDDVFRDTVIHASISLEKASGAAPPPDVAKLTATLREFAAHYWVARNFLTQSRSTINATRRKLSEV